MKSNTIVRRLAQVARPGVIVSTLVDYAGNVETATFTRNSTETIGFDISVQRSDDPSDALAMQALAMAAVSR